VDQVYSSKICGNLHGEKLRFPLIAVIVYIGYSSSELSIDIRLTLLLTQAGPVPGCEGISL